MVLEDSLFDREKSLKVTLQSVSSSRYEAMYGNSSETSAVITICVAVAEELLDLSSSLDQPTVSGFLGTTASLLSFESTLPFDCLVLG